MEDNVEKEILRDGVRNTKRKVLISGIVGILVILSAYIFSVAYGVLLSDKIYDGVIVSGVKIGGLTKNEAKGVLEKNYVKNNNLKSIVLQAKELTEKINFEKAEVVYDINKLIEEAYDIGRKGTLLEQFVNKSFNKSIDISLEIPVSYNKKYVEDIAESMASKLYIPPKEYEIIIDSPQKVSIKTGCHGEMLKQEEVIQMIDSAIKSGKETTLRLELSKIMPQKIQLEEALNKVVAEPVNSTTQVIDNQIKIIPEKYGRKIEKNELSAILLKIDGLENHEEVLPVEFVPAILKKEDISPLILREELASFSTQFYTGDENNNNRKVNIEIAASKINGKILEAGQVFSFNDVVGPRTASRGYKPAHAYSLGKIVDSYGGGICQVSTTLYNAVLLADLEIVERNSHIYTVGYVPLGRDAAVSYDECDFKFKNTTNYPLKINCWLTSDNRICFSLTGTNESPRKTIDFRYETVKEIEPTESKIYDSNMPSGSKTVIDWGMKGYVIKTYKIIRQEGMEDKESLLSTSEYFSLPKKVKIGTGK